MRFILLLAVMFAGVVSASAQKIVYTDASEFPLYGKVSE